ncbi:MULTISPECIES: thymidylate synthase [unclassified Haladaptatus]|uniref:thymidylate synthase n=1 Tax=unclassified Haladaptatus TaxID=2622732 RepID=UPI00209BEEFE|nr:MULTISPECIES: thymidylate synthase [unclassified Haladaptatus]MCO8246832.1 thymidylate synthase [Haladaptatus sp. AB643]MCO8253642.1 thymidylate synthase [Haladaptatus sp. AB618]
MKQYLDLIEDVLRDGTYKPNRTGVDTISTFSQHYEVDLRDGFPLLTTKEMDGFRWDSMLHELLWYLSGEEHVRNLREKTGIWNEWSNEEGHLDTAYGRFWRRFPVPEEGLPGESWPEDGNRWMNEDGTFDQIQYVIDGLNENPNSRRFVVSAWHPANAAVSTLPPCHYTFVINVQGDGTLNLHLTQRSGDVALGIPFNVAAYAILATVLAQQTGFEVGKFSHTIVDAHIYCGEGERGEWYRDNLPALQSRLADVSEKSEYEEIREWLESEAPEEETDRLDHVPGLLTQLSREPKSRPKIDIAADSIDELSYEDITLREYDAHPGLKFGVAE